MIRPIKKKIVQLLNKGNERTVLTKKNIFASFGIKILTIFMTMMLMPLTIGYVNEERNGIWFTMTNMVMWIAIFDFGLGSGLKNKYAEAKAKGDMLLAKKYVSSTYAIIGLLWLIVFAVFSLINPFLDWSAIFPKVSPEYLQELYETTWIVVFSFGTLFVVKLLSNIVIADQRPAIASLIDMFGQLLTLIGVFLLAKLTPASLPKLGFVAGFSPVIVFLIASVYLFSTRYKEVRPSFRFVDFKLGKVLLNLGLKFFVLTIAAFVVSTTLSYLITYIVNPAETTKYNVSFKLFSILMNVLAIVIIPYWSAFTDAHTLKDYKWMQESVKNLRKFFGYFLILQLIILALSPVLYYFWINIWLKDEVLDISFWMSLVVCLYVCSMVWLDLNIYPINGTGKIKLQLYSALFEMVCFIPLAVYLGNRIGVIGIIMAPVIIYIPRMIWAPIQLNKLVKGNAEGIWNK
ncbi:MAG: MATE family efflux transporter [Dysgonamonadaceae bacterium]|jgi:O-antigen/teichoic acid export membrane protein|nr:MATE family efflux transporter [Dysgonamonadaceae bacterium]